MKKHSQQESSAPIRPTRPPGKRLRLLPGLSKKNWGREVTAGVTLVAIAVPLNIGYAQIAGLPATAGLYALIAPAIIFALLASTRQLVALPDAAASALIASSLIGLAAANSDNYIQLSLAQALVAGCMFGLVALFKLGFLANFLSEPILIGFVGGLALDILISQVAKMLGVPIESGDEFIERVGQLFAGLDAINLWAVLLACISVAILLVGRRVSAAVPWALVALIVTTLVLSIWNLDEAGVSVLGEIEAGPPSITWPAISAAQWVQLVPSAFALVLVTMAEGLLVARRYAAKNGYPVDANRDLFAFGAANVAAGVTGGFAVGSSASRTAAIDATGSRTQLPAIVAAVLALLLVIFGTALLVDLPSPAIGAIVAVAVAPLIGIGEFSRLWKLSRSEFAVGATCFFGSLLLGPIVGIVIAFFLSLVTLAARAAHPPVSVLALDESIPKPSLRGEQSNAALTAPGVVVMRFAAPAFFANAVFLRESIHERILTSEELGLKHFVLDCESISDIDITAANVLNEAAAWTRDRDVTFDFSRVTSEFAALLKHFDLIKEGRIFSTNREALSVLTEGP